jgi:hypothetical protein
VLCERLSRLASDATLTGPPGEQPFADALPAGLGQVGHLVGVVDISPEIVGRQLTGAVGGLTEGDEGLPAFVRGEVGEVTGWLAAPRGGEDQINGSRHDGSQCHTAGGPVA